MSDQTDYDAINDCFPFAFVPVEDEPTESPLMKLVRARIAQHEAKLFERHHDLAPARRAALWRRYEPEVMASETILCSDVVARHVREGIFILSNN